VQAITQEADGAAAHPVTKQVAAVDDRCAGGQGGTIGIDETAAVATDACRVGNHDLGAAARYFDIAVEQAGVLAVDFVQDDFGSAACKVGVALHPAAEL